MIIQATARDDSNSVQATAIRWNPESVTKSEDLDPLTMDDAELFQYCVSLQRDISALRLVLHAAVAALAKVTNERERALASVRSLTKQLRTLARAA